MWRYQIYDKLYWNVYKWQWRESFLGIYIDGKLVRARKIFALAIVTTRPMK